MGSEMCIRDSSGWEGDHLLNTASDRLADSSVMLGRDSQLMRYFTCVPFLLCRNLPTLVPRQARPHDTARPRTVPSRSGSAAARPCLHALPALLLALVALAVFLVRTSRASRD